MINSNITLPNIFICGPSGYGKSSSLRNMNPETTAVLNIERKQLPFRNAAKFKYNKMISSFSDLDMEIRMGIGMNPAIDTVVIESFASADEDILSTCRKTYTGWDVFGKHNEIVRNFISFSKFLSQPREKIGPKFVVFIGLDEVVDIIQASGSNKSARRVKVAGKELQGTIEKEFTIVLFTEIMEAQMAGKLVSSYKFLTNSDGVCSAKTPLDMFKDRLIDNDLNMVLEEVKKYYDIKTT